MTRQAIIYHNPNCSKSRYALRLLREAGITPTVIEYLHTPLSQVELHALTTQLGLPLIDILRTDDALFSELDLSLTADEETLLAAVEQYPALLNRPIVITAKGACLCRPPERVFEIL